MLYLSHDILVTHYRATIFYYSSSNKTNPQENCRSNRISVTITCEHVLFAKNCPSK